MKKRKKRVVCKHTVHIFGLLCLHVKLEQHKSQDYIFCNILSTPSGHLYNRLFT